MFPFQSKGQLEAEIAKGMTQFQREHLGRGPQDVRVWIIQNMILIRFRGVLTPAEKKLARDSEGQQLVKRVRRHLLEGSRSILNEMIQSLTGIEVVSMHSDISTQTGERIVVFTLVEDLEARFRY